MEKDVEIFVLVNCFVIGASHLIQPQAWVDFFKMLGNLGRPGAFANGFLSLTFGSIIVAFHWVWVGVLPTIVTCMGIAQIMKSMMSFLAPHLVLKTWQRPMATSPLGYRLGGAIFLGFSGLLTYHLLGE